MSSHRTRATLLLTAALLTGIRLSQAQAPHPLTAADIQRVNDLISKMTLEQKLAYIGGTGFAVRAVPSLGLPALEMSDGPIGTRSNDGLPSTAYAAGIGLAATWDRDLAARVGAGIGRDARARGVHFMLGPGVNIDRSPRNSRNFEYFGEDPFLASRIAVGYITGMQQQGVSATIKHYAANSNEYLRHDSDSIVDERTLREIYLPTFEAAVKQAHVGAIMDSYNLINGEHATQNSHLNTEIVRKDWGFQGTMMSDWDATYDATAAANGGLDLEMPHGTFMNAKNLLPAIQSGKVSEATINEKIRHILSTAAMFGWLDRPQIDTTLSLMDARNSATALDTARESVVLLKNQDALLPLDRKAVKTILVVGPNAYPGVPVGGGSAGVRPFHAVSALEGLANYLGGSGVNVLYDRGLPTLADLAERTEFYTAAADGARGATLEIFSGSDLSGSPVSTSVVPHISVPDGSAGATRRWTAFYRAAKDGKYIVALQGSPEGTGNRVFVDDKPVIDNWKIIRAWQPHVSLELSAGPHKIVVEDTRSGSYGGTLRLGITPEDEIVNGRAKQLAAKADVILLSAGFQSGIAGDDEGETEGEGGDRTFTLPFGQGELIRSMSSINPKTIVTITSGGNVDSQSWLDRVPALLETWYAGQSGGTALAEILFGDVNPSGHLPVTFERRAEDNPAFAHYYPEGDTRRVLYQEGIFVGYRGYERNKTQPLFPFGYGLSYTTFKFANLTVTPAAGSSGPSASFDVTNTGTRKGATIAQLYVGEDKPKVERPAHELKGFERVELGPGETRHITIHLDARAFAYYDVAGKRWTANPGRFTLYVGDSVASTPLKGTLELSRQAAMIP